MQMRHRRIARISGQAYLLSSHYSFPNVNQYTILLQVVILAGERALNAVTHIFESAAEVRILRAQKLHRARQRLEQRGVDVFPMILATY